ncbi:quinolinate synthase NadA [candidate division KSB1 bacterium]|nr:quinolinate synthase NadA [candidate division KSB1 bacterium]
MMETYIDVMAPEIQTSETEESVVREIREIRMKLGEKVLILAHHYQCDSVFQFADNTGDSLGLSKYAAEKASAEFIIFCGVHFMAETADILTPDFQKVILPDLRAGCSMADMANFDQTEECWEILSDASSEKVIPVTYINSTAAIKAFCGRNDGTVCTSSNAEKVLKWALEKGGKVLFLPDQHLGRNVAYKMGIPLEKMVMYDPKIPGGGEPLEAYAKAQIILWQGFCSVHMNFREQYIGIFRERYPDITILVHPECSFEVVQKADYCGSTAFIIKMINEAPYGSKWAIGTESHLVERLKNLHPDKFISPLSAYACQCATMFRIDAEHLLKTLKEIDRGEVSNIIRVPKDIADDAKIALDRMLEITG